MKYSKILHETGNKSNMRHLHKRQLVSFLLLYTYDCLMADSGSTHVFRWLCDVIQVWTENSDYALCPIHAAEKYNIFG